MLMNTDSVNLKRYTEEVNIPNGHSLGHVHRFIKESGVEIASTVWKSKYNSYVVYDYEPFCSDGFNITMKVTSDEEYRLNYFNYMYDNWTDSIFKFEKTHDISIPRGTKLANGEDIL